MGKTHFFRGEGVWRQGACGAGTVLKPEQVDQLAGVERSWSPKRQPEVIRRGSELLGDRVSGCAAAAEALLCADTAQALKIFPIISAFGPGTSARAESGTSAGCSAICRQRRDAGKRAIVKAGCVGAGLGSVYRAGASVERTAQQAAAFDQCVSSGEIKKITHITVPFTSTLDVPENQKRMKAWLAGRIAVS